MGLISCQPFSSEVPPEKAGIIPAGSTCAITPIARTTCQSFSTRPGRVPRAAATSSTRRRSGTLEAQTDAAVSNLPAHATGNANHAAGRHLRRLAGVVGLLEARRHRLDADPAERFSQGRKPSCRHRLAARDRGAGTGIQPPPYSDETALPDDFAQRPPDLVVAVEILEIGAHERITALVLD